MEDLLFRKWKIQGAMVSIDITIQQINSLKEIIKGRVDCDTLDSIIESLKDDKECLEFMIPTVKAINES